jgi:FlaA1/EpsC-like NDP-sugar epimerase
MSEEFLSQDESTEPTVDPRLLRAKTREVPTDKLNIQMEDLSRWVDERNLTAMIETLCQIVPDYRPTDLLSPSTLGSSV